ncbi:MAG TPA: hypothetical protein VES63_00035 [Candidatus Acidoferrum sp.]|nr:hypothetical protein [Candidatus Acidoferrum sp.]
MSISTSKGKRHPDDIIIKYNDLPISMMEIAKILLLLWDNEDKLHPPPRKGAKMSLEFINDLFEARKLTDELLKKYHLTNRNSSSITIENNQNDD